MKEQQWKTAIFCFLSAQTVSLLGSSLVQYAIVWYITLSTSSGTMLTISTLCGFVPQILISLFGGVWIDRYNRKYLIMLSDSMIALATLCLAIPLFLGKQHMGLLFGVLIIRSVGTGIQTPAVNAMIPQIVPPARLMKINGIYSTISSMIMLLSPALSGAILSVASLEYVLLIDVATAIIGVCITAFIQVKSYGRTEKPGESMMEEIRKGYDYVKENPWIVRLLLYQALTLFLISPSAFLTPLMVSRSFGPEIWRLTASEMTYSVGMVCGGLLIASWGGFKKKLNTTLFAGALYGFLMIGLGTAPVFIIYLACNTIIGITSPCYQAPITVTIQERVDARMQGRVFSFMQIATSCALPLGMVLFGPLADRIAVGNLLTGAGIVVLITSVLIRKANLLTYQEPV